MIALNGRVPVKVNMEGGPISLGDNIAISSVPGVGKKATVSGETVVGVALDDYKTVTASGTVLVFVGNKTNLTIADQVRQKLFTADLNATSTVFSTLTADTTDTIWNRLVKLAEGFKDGVLTLAGFKADKIETNQLCVGSTCITESELKDLINQKNAAAAQSSTPTPTPAPSPTPIPSPTAPDPVTTTSTTTPPTPIPIPDPVPVPTDTPTPTPDPAPAP
jgi:hypothetical protein